MRQWYSWKNRMTMIGLTILLIIGAIPLQQAHALPLPVAFNVDTQTNYSDLQSAFNSASDGDTIELLRNINISTSGSAIVYSNPGTIVTLDLYGYNLIRQAPAGMLDGGDGAAIQISSGTLTIQDGKAGQTGSVQLQNSNNSVGSAVNIAANGTLNLKSGSLLGDGQGIFAYEAGAHFNISGGMVYGSANTGSSEGIAATTKVYGTISGGYIGTKNPASAMIWTASPLSDAYWSITGGYFTSDSYNDSNTHTIASFIKSGTIITLNPPVMQPLSGSTPYRYQLSLLSKEQTPLIVLNPYNEVLFNLVPDASYTVNGDTYTADANGTIALHANWMNSNLSIVKTGIPNVSTDSNAELLTIPARPAAPAVTADDAYDEVVGFAPGMEYSLDGGPWMEYIQSALPQLSGDHTLKVRTRATVYPVLALASEVTTLTFHQALALAGYNVSGDVIEQINNLPQSVAGANVQLYQGNSPVGTTVVTDTYGRFKLSGISNGTYNLVITKENRMTTYLVHVNNSDYNFDGRVIFLSSGHVNSEVKITGTDTPNVAVGGLNNLFQDPYSILPADQQLIANGGKVDIALVVQKQNATNATGTAAITTLASGQTIQLYLDMTLLKTSTTATNQSSTSIIPTIGNLLQIVVPYDSTGQSNVIVYRYHNGAAQQLAALPYNTATPTSEGYMVDPSGKQITIWSQNFSTYAIASGAKITTPVVSSGGGGSSFTTGASYPITVTSSAGGTISPSSLPGVLKGSNQTFTFTPDKGYTIKDVLIDGKSVGIVGSYTFKNVIAAHTVKVVFAAVPSTTTPADLNTSTGEGLPYYMDGNQKVYIGFAARIDGKMNYIAPVGKEVEFASHSQSFSDMNGHWAVESVSFVSDRDILLGTGKDQFAPNKAMTRAMFAVAIGRLYERSYGSLNVTGASKFNDVSANSWYGTYVNWAAQNGMIQGMSATSFDPNRNITREEMAALLYRFATFMQMNQTIQPDQKLAYADAGNIAAWAKPAVQFFDQKDIINGRTTTQFAPKQPATRAEAAAVLERFIELVVTQTAK